MIRFAWLDYLATLRERKVWLAAAIFAYCVLAIPFMLTRPPSHVREAINAFFESQDPFTLFMFVWTDLAMNKVIATVAVVLAGGLILRERDTGVLPVLASKPITLPRLFAVRAISTCGVMATLYVGAHLAGAAYFASHVEGFRPLTFLAAMSLHVWSAIFATAFAATIGVAVGRRGLGVLVALVSIFSLVGLAFIGFYNPAWRGIARLNPFSLGVEAIGRLDALGPGNLLPPMLALVALTALTIAAGAHAVRRMEA